MRHKIPFPGLPMLSLSAITNVRMIIVNRIATAMPRFGSVSDLNCFTGPRKKPVPQSEIIVPRE